MDSLKPAGLEAEVSEHSGCCVVPCAADDAPRRVRPRRAAAGAKRGSQAGRTRVPSLL